MDQVEEVEIISRIDDEMVSMLDIVSPGTKLREGLENILRAKTGALIVVGNSNEVLEVVDGGFNLNCELHPSRLYELAKMDGGIVLSEEADIIIYANAHLVPDQHIPTTETGARHRTAERVAKQTGQLVVSISQRRDMITLYKGKYKYVLRDLGVILAKANQAVQTLEKYRNVLDQALTNLTALEFEDLVTLSDVVTVIQRTEMVLRIGAEIERYIKELGDEGRLINMQLEELMSDVKTEGLLLINDYGVLEKGQSPEEIMSSISEWSSDDLLDLTTISRVLGHGGSMSSLDLNLSPAGYRVLNKIPRLPMAVIENLVENFSSLQLIIEASIEELDEVEGIGEVRARAIKEGLKRLRDQVLLDRHI